MREIKFLGQVTDGKLSDDVRRLISAAITAFDGKRIIVTLKAFHKKRSLKQNSFYWAAVIPMIVMKFREEGDLIDGEEAHDYLMREVGKYTFRSQLTGNMLRRSSSDLTISEWEEFMTAIRAWAAPFNISVPFPNEADQWE